MIYEYRSGKTISKLELPKGSIPGEIHYSKDGSVGVVEEVDSSTLQRKALHVFELKNLVWKKLTY